MKKLRNRQCLLTGMVALGIAGGSSTHAPAIADAVQTANEIRAEATRTNSDAAGRALPLLSSWNTGHSPRVRGIDPAFQMSLVEAGHHVLPSFVFPSPGGNTIEPEKIHAYYEVPLRRAAELQLPITLVSTQWEHLLTNDKAYFDLPADENPNVVTPDGEVLKKVSPFGPVKHWREVGAKWASSPLVKQLQEWYPNPPQVILLSNNEHAKLRWRDVETDARYLEKYGKGRDGGFKRKVIGDGWIERYRALQEGMREALVAPAWRERAVFIGYDAFGTQVMGRWPGWTTYAQHSPGRIDPNPLMWDGGSPSYYTDDWNSSTDFRTHSPQVETMNWVFMQQQALELNPNFRFDLSIWDGQEFDSTRSSKYQPKPDFYRSLGQTYGPQRYAGLAQFGLWLLRPRVLREYRGWQNDLEAMKPYFLALAESVDRVYQNEKLKFFWRQGTLVANNAHPHPYQSGIPEEYKTAERWFLLDTNLDPPRPWKLDTEIPVFSLALVNGSQGNRKWLVYAHSPVQDRKAVEITIPGYGRVTVDVPVAGAFYEVDEATKKTSPVA